MSAQLAQLPRQGWRFWVLWMLATAVGAVVGMACSLPLNLVLVSILRSENIPPPWTATQTILIVLFKGAEGGVMGLGMGWGQWWLLRKHLKPIGGWVLATGLALFLQGAFRWSLPYDTPPWQVGIITALSFGVFLGVCQWFVLRGRVPNAGAWIAINFAGWVAALAIGALGEYGRWPIDSLPGAVLFVLIFFVPFAVAGGGMVGLLRPSRQAQPIAA